WRVVPHVHASRWCQPGPSSRARSGSRTHRSLEFWDVTSCRLLYRLLATRLVVGDADVEHADRIGEQVLEYFSFDRAIYEPSQLRIEFPELGLQDIGMDAELRSRPAHVDVEIIGR